MALPGLSRRDPVTGEPRKQQFGAWVLPFLSLLAKARRLRGTPFDPFGYSAERRGERALIRQYVTAIQNDVLPKLSAQNHRAAVAIAAAAQAIKGFGHVKQRSRTMAIERQEGLLAAYLQS